MESLKDRVAIVGMGCTSYGDHYDKSAEDLLVEACYEAFEDAGVDQSDIQAAWIGGGITGQTLAHALKLDFVPVTRVENWCATGSDTLRNAILAVNGGACDVVLVAGVEANKEAVTHDLGKFGGGPVGNAWFFGEEAPFAGSATSTFATVATRYAHQYELTYDQLKTALGSISLKNYAHGRLNPKAALHKNITMEDYLKAPMIAWPLGLHDCCTMPNGAAAAIVTRAELAPKFRDDFVLVKGVGMSVGTKQGRLDTDYDFTHFEENVIAGQRAYEMAGIREPFKEIDLACVHDAFTVVELAVYEDLNFAPRGAGGDYVKDGAFSLGTGDLVVNSNGGLKSFGHGVGGSGIHKAYEVYKQIQGKCGDRQVKNATFGLTHDQGGYPGTYTTVITLLGARD